MAYSQSVDNYMQICNTFYFILTRLLLNISLILQFAAVAIPSYAQGIGALQMDLSSYDSSKVRAEVNKKNVKFKIHPQTADLIYFMGNTGKYPLRIVCNPSNPKDTLAYESYSYDTNAVNTSFYRNETRYTMADLGETGSPMHTLTGQSLMVHNKNPLSLDGLIRIGFNPFACSDNYPEDMQFYQAFAPFTQFNYMQGPGNTIALKALHTQNFSPGWNIALDYNSSVNQEQYLGSLQNNTRKRIRFGSLFQSQNKRFKQIIVFSWNRSRRVENGGLANDSLFFIPVNSSQWQMRPLGYYTPQLDKAKSSIENNKHLLWNRYQLNTRPQWFLTESMVWEKVKFQYKDENRDSNYYGSQTFNETKKVADSSAWNLFTHRFGLERHLGLGYRNAVIGLNHVFQSGQYQFIQPNFLNKQSVKKVFSQGFQAKWNSDRINLNGEFMFSGYSKGSHTVTLRSNTLRIPLRNKSDTVFLEGVKSMRFIVNEKGPIDSFRLEGLTKYFFVPKQTLGIELGITSQMQYASLFQYQFESNHYQFERNFEPTGSRSLQIGITHKKGIHSKSFLRIFSDLGILDRPLVSIDSLPATQLLSVQFAKIELQKCMKYKKITILQSILYQSYKKHELNLLFNMGMPKWLSTTSIFYEAPIFHKAMKLRLGTDFRYVSHYQNIFYRADAASFIYASQGKQLGNYLELDVYANARVQWIDIFVRIEHLNELVVIPGFNTRFQYIQGYPTQPYRIRFGLQWKFFN
ncbi:MAG: hypothetical protein EXR17_01355 [Flavobacteriaceae bacterium]|nr:hypothetical protein [Flavobacteriaceae bacterium]